ncbi:D-alanine--D-alanine ligase family protein [Mariniluteicoccus flavus]
MNGTPHAPDRTPAPAPAGEPSSGRPTVALVFGGDSSEHGVSCLTAASVARAIDPERYDVVGIGITRDGRWVQVPAEEVRALQVVGRDLPTVPSDRGEAVLLRHADGAEVATVDGDRLVDRRVVNVAFALLHGTFGEDGTVQGLFEMMGVRYVGSGVMASATGMDKHVMKMVLAASGLPVGPYVVVLPHEWVSDPAACLDAVSALEFPVFVKPARGGSSMGISRVTEPAGVEAAIEEARRFDPKVIVEQGFTDIREVECGVLQDPDGGAPRVSSVAEIVMHTEDRFYDFDAKYLPEGQVTIDLPADLPEEVADEVRRVGAKAFTAMGCEGLARVDCFVGAQNCVWVNEINTMPGFTATSMFPEVWKHAGVAYADLIDHLVGLALTRPLGLR